MLATMNPLETKELERLKLQGQAYLKSNQVDKALIIYAGILQEHPDDVVSLLILGDSYLVAGDRKAALSLYREASRWAPQRKDIERRIELLQRNCAPSLFESSPKYQPTQPQAVFGLLQNLTGKPVISEEEVQRAQVLLDEVLQADSPAQAVAEHLDEIDTLLPALIELNIRQARSEGRVDLAEDLQNLLADVYLQIDLNALAGKPAAGNVIQAQRVLVVGIDSYESPFRRTLLAQALADLGYEVSQDAGSDWNAYDLVLAHNPHGRPDLMKRIAVRVAAGLPVVLDLDLDFAGLTEEHPDYETLGPGDPQVARAYTAALQICDRITVASSGAAEKLRKEGYQVLMVPDGWNQRNALWQRPVSGRTSLNIGIMTVPGQMEDVLPIRRAVVRILREFPQTRLVISGDPQLYQLFDNVPEVRRLFLPTVEPEDYPYLLSQVDILLVPLCDNEVNQQRSDRRLMEAGVRQIPWIASPTQAHGEWKAGGIVARSYDEWYSHLRNLVTEREMARSLGAAGHEQALQREMHFLGRTWASLIQELAPVKDLA